MHQKVSNSQIYKLYDIICNNEEECSVRAHQRFSSEDIIKAYNDKTILGKLYKTAQHNLIANELLREWYVICWNSYFGCNESKKR